MPRNPSTRQPVKRAAKRVLRGPSTRRPVKRAKADPGLLKQLRDSAQAEKPVEAVFTLRLPKGLGAGPKRTEGVARRILDRVARSAGSGAFEVSVFANLGAFAVSAPPKFVRALLKEPEISSAVSNRPVGRVPSGPRKKRR
jgi:hypothetical protein